MAIPEAVKDEVAHSSVAGVPRRGGLDVRTIAEAALLLDVTVLLVLVRTFLPVPVLFGIIGLACPVPFVLLALRRGGRAGGVATLAAFVLLSTFIGPLVATQVLVFGGLGILFAWASQRRVHAVPTIVVGAILYGVLYLTPPFLFGLTVLRINLGQTLHDVKSQAGQFLNGLGHLHLLGVHVGEGVVAFFSSFAPGRALLDGLHGASLFLLTHPLFTLVAFFAGYSLLHVWAYLIVSVELYQRLPFEARRDERGGRIDFFPVG